MQRKYELTDEFIEMYGVRLFRIKALVDFAEIKAGKLGGYIEKEENLSQDGKAWVYEEAKVSGKAEVSGEAEVYGKAEVSGEAKVSGNADYATARGFGRVYRTTTFFRTRDKRIAVNCGCFYGTLDEFRSKVKETHGESKTAKEYMMLADLMEYRFSN